MEDIIAKRGSSERVLDFFGAFASTMGRTSSFLPLPQLPPSLSEQRQSADWVSELGARQPLNRRPRVAYLAGLPSVKRISYEHMQGLQSALIAQSQGVLPTGLGNFDKNFLANLATELLTHSVEMPCPSMTSSGKNQVAIQKQTS